MKFAGCIASAALVAVSAWALDARAGEAEETGTFPRRVELERCDGHFWLDVPKAYFEEETEAGKEAGKETRWPLVVALHGAGDTAKNFITGFWPIVRAGYLIVAPKSPGAAWSGNEEDLVMAAIAEVKEAYRVDAGRISLAGFSSGAYFGMPLAFRRPDVFNALVAMGGGGYAGASRRARRLHVYLLAGEKDPARATLESAHRQLERKRMDVTLRIVPGIGHVWPPEAEIRKIERWFYGFSPAGLKAKALARAVEKAEALLSRGRKRAAIGILKETEAEEIACGAVERAKEALEALEKEADAEIARARDLAGEGKTTEAKILLLKISRDYRGLEAAEEAKRIASVLQ